MPVPYLTLPDIAAVYRISPRTARRWAAHDRWRRKTTGRSVRYSMTDAQASYEKHQRKRLTHHRVKRNVSVSSLTVTEGRQDHAR